MPSGGGGIEIEFLVMNNLTGLDKFEKKTIGRRNPFEAFFFGGNQKSGALIAPGKIKRDGSAGGKTGGRKSVADQADLGPETIGNGLVNLIDPRFATTREFVAVETVVA